MADIVMPQLGETVTEGTITRWLKQVGDPVAEDEVLFEVSTDKVDSEVPSPSAGVLSEILVAEGDTVDVGTRLAVISDSANGDSPNGAAATEPAAQTEGPAETESEPPAADIDVAAGGETAEEEPAPTEPAPSEPAVVTGPPAAERADDSVPTAEDAPAAEDAAAAGAGSSRQTGGAATRPSDDRPPSQPGGGGGKVLSPVVRRLIAEYGLDAAQIAGTGTGGRITRSDVLALIDQQRGAGAAAPTSSGTSSEAPAPAPAAAPAAAPPAAKAPAPPRAPVPAPSPAEAPAPAAQAPAPAPAAAAPSAPAPAAEGDRVVRFTNIRRRTAEHMVRSKATSAHAMVAVEVDYEGIDRVRLPERAEFQKTEGFGLTYLPFISRAVVDAIGHWPYVNSSVGNDELIVHRDINLGIAVDLNFEGLLVPVIHQADGKRLRQLARDISGLAAKARAKRLTMDDISGGTFTLTNAGPFGTLITVPVINQPQVAILSTDGVRKKPVVVELPDGTDAIAIHPVGNLVMSWDHRAFDGAYAAAFVAAIKKTIETRDWSAEL